VNGRGGALGRQVLPAIATADLLADRLAGGDRQSRGGAQSRFAARSAGTGPTPAHRVAFPDGPKWTVLITFLWWRATNSRQVLLTDTHACCPPGANSYPEDPASGVRSDTGRSGPANAGVLPRFKQASRVPKPWGKAGPGPKANNRRGCASCLIKLLRRS